MDEGAEPGVTSTPCAQRSEGKAISILSWLHEASFAEMKQLLNVHTPDSGCCEACYALVGVPGVDSKQQQQTLSSIAKLFVTKAFLGTDKIVAQELTPDFCMLRDCGLIHSHLAGKQGWIQL